MPDNSGRILVKFSINNQDFKLPKYTVAKITSLDLLGSKSIHLILGHEIDDFHNHGDTLKSSVEASLSEEVNNQILPLKMKAEDLLSSMDTVIQVVRAILNKEARENLSASFENIKNAMGTFEVVAMRVDTMISEEKAKLASIMTNFNSISNNLRNNNENITLILDNIAFITDSLAASNITQTINNASLAFRDAAVVMRKIERGEGTIGQLVNNDSLYFHLEHSARDLDKLLIDIEEHPNRYVRVSVFGGKDKEEKRREKERKKKEKEAQNALKP
jgi:phospholipid/cholesterol/gamma-HCH transport system substrate-binding protein